MSLFRFCTLQVFLIIQTLSSSASAASINTSFASKDQLRQLPPSASIPSTVTARSSATAVSLSPSPIIITRTKATAILAEKMAPKSQSTDEASSPSVLRELKETIQKQSKEIEQLQAALKDYKSKTKSTAATAHHGHGPASDDQDPKEYLASPFYKLALNRVPWLFVFLMSLSLTAVIMNGFEHTLSKQIELAYFVPLLAGHGGNTGGQTVGTVLSALSTNAISTKDAFTVIRKEAMSGLTVGILLASFVGPAAYYVGGISAHVSTVVFCTLPLLSTIAATLASAIPMLCATFGLDPAVIAAPAMTTFVDVSGLLSYFIIANKIFKLFGLEL